MTTRRRPAKLSTMPAPAIAIALQLPQFRELLAAALWDVRRDRGELAADAAAAQLMVRLEADTVLDRMRELAR